MPPIKTSLKTQALLIVGTGILFSLIFFFIPEVRIHSYWVHLMFSTGQTAVLWLGCSAIVSYLWGKYPWERQPLRHLITEVVLIIAYTNAILWLMMRGLEAINWPMHCNDVAEEYITTNIITLFISSLHETIFFYKQWKYNFSKSIRLERDHFEAKLEILKAQLNPHFLFNSLNSLASMLDDQPEAERYVQDLSYFMRYILTNRDNELVPLRQELEMLNKYIALQKVRFEENLRIDIQVEDAVQDRFIPPLALQILLENCIKHNIITTAKPLFIYLKSEDNRLAVRNNLQPKSHVHSSGHGLRNIIERYAFYSQAEVQIENTGDFFTVTIPLIKLER